MKKISVEQMEDVKGGYDLILQLLCEGLEYAIFNMTLSTFDHVQAVNLYNEIC